MNHLEFRTKVKELRISQKYYWRLKKEDPVKEVAKRKMRNFECVIRAEIKNVLAYRSKGKSVQSDEEQFFLDVAEMMEKQLVWMMNKSYFLQEAAREKEKVVDEWIRVFEEREKKEKIEAEERLQLKLFDNE